MTLILAAPVGAALFVSTDSYSGMGPAGPVIGRKVLLWPKSGLLLTGFGHFSMPLLALAEHHVRLSHAFATTPRHVDRTACLMSMLNEHPHVHAQEGSEATCLFFGFEDGEPVTSVLQSAGGVGSWESRPDARLPLAAGYLEPIGLSPTSGITSVVLQCEDEAAYCTWRDAKYAEAVGWFREHAVAASILPPYACYRMDASSGSAPTAA